MPSQPPSAVAALSPPMFGQGENIDTYGTAVQDGNFYYATKT